MSLREQLNALGLSEKRVTELLGLYFFVVTERPQQSFNAGDYIQIIKSEEG